MPQQRGIGAMSETYTRAHGNAGSLMNWVRPGIEPITSWLLVRVISITPKWERLNFFFNCDKRKIYSFFFLNLWPHLQHVKVPGPGTESELQLQPMPYCGITGSFNLLHLAGDWIPASAWTQAAAVGFLTHWATAGIPHLNHFLMFPVQ